MSRTAALPPAALQTDRGGFRSRQLSGSWGISPLSRGKQWPPGLALAFVHASNSSARLHSLKCPDSHTGEESSARTSMSIGGQGTARRSGKFGSFLAAGSFGLRWCERVFGSSRGLESVLGPEKRGVSIWQQISRRGGVGSARTVICEASESGDLGTGTGVITPGVPDTMLMTGGESRTDKLWRVYSKWTTPFVRYSISCSISNVLYFVVYLLLLRVIPSAGVAVTIAYLASVTWQHALHRILVYGKGLNISSAYFRELAGIYMAYSVAFILNPIITEGVIKAGEAHILRTGDVALQHYLKPLGFAASLVLTGILNFFTVTAVFEATAGAENQQRIAEKEKAFKE